MLLFLIKTNFMMCSCSHNHGYQPGVIVSKHNSAEEAKQRKNFNNLKQYTCMQMEET